MRRPIDASSPIVLNENDFKGRSESEAAIFCATMFPSRMACCAVRGCDFPGFLISGTNAQSPTAQTLGQSGTCKNWFTSSRPCSFGQVTWKYSKPDDNLWDWNMSLYGNRTDNDQTKTYHYSTSGAGYCGAGNVGNNIS